ncbi:unnamed protein product [Ilex paraguariensis]|uniref:Steroid 5-alpha reductase C-terminal domain-containing protein n=1 Tax=Ilex paraguariensis TaxID=185542 RepID=A0ABC8R540_9AQUA
MRSNLGKLAIFWLLQAVWVWTVSLPVTIVNSSNRYPSLHAEDIIGWAMWSVGILVEATADQQKLAFKNVLENRGKWCNVGVWKYSRHPNYFGEIFLWWGIFVASTPVLEGAEWLVVFGPILLTLLLLFLSGVPMLEDSADKKFGNVAGYRHYKRTTSPLILLPPEVYGSLPSWFKTTFLFEFPFYSRNLPQEEMLSCSGRCVLFIIEFGFILVHKTHRLHSCRVTFTLLHILCIHIFLWWGIFVASTPVLEGAEWLVVFGPILLTLLLLFLSGVPMLEDSADKKFGNVAGYRHYKRTTSPLILLPPEVYGSLPSWFKTTFLFEFPFYSRNLPQEEMLSW